MTLGLIMGVKAIPVIATDKQGTDFRFESSMAGSRAFNVPASNIRKVMNGERAMAGGYVWRKEGTDLPIGALDVFVTYQEAFVGRSQEIYGADRYTYLEVPESSADHFKLHCNMCDTTFAQKAATHLNGNGCNVCASKKVGLLQQYSREEVFDMFYEQHGDKYDYSLVEGVTARDLATIICPIHGPFQQLVGSHRKGCGCPSCSVGGFNGVKPAILYYLRVDRYGIVAYKIGITNRTVQERFGTEFQYITILKTWDYEVGEEARIVETAIKRENKEFKYTGISLLESGNTELFTHDIGGFDG